MGRSGTPGDHEGRAHPPLSVIVPTRNRVAVLAGVLNAWLSQAREIDAEVIVIDDGSTDGTCRLLENVEGSGARLRWARQTPAGPAAARNRGIDMACGRLLLFTGDDMFPAPGLLAGHLHAHAARTRAAVLGSVLWDPAIRLSPLMRMMAPKGPLFNFDKAARSPDRRHRFFYTANLSISVETLGGERFHEAFRGAAFEDVELGVRLERLGVVLAYCPDLVVYHRHALAAKDLLARLEVLRDGRKVLADLHPELSPGWAGRMREWGLKMLVRAWVPVERICGLCPRTPEHWTTSDS